MSYEIARRAALHLTIGAVLAVALVGVLPGYATTLALLVGVGALAAVGMRKSVGAAAAMVGMWVLGGLLAGAVVVGLLFVALAGGAQIG